MKRFAVLLMPYFGKWPEWIDIYVESCRWNPGIDVCFLTDCGATGTELPKNVMLFPLTFSQFNDLYQKANRNRERASDIYKLCDFRPAFGRMFFDLVSRYEWYGWGDVDVVYGNLESYTKRIANGFDAISFNSGHLSGHLTLVKSCLAKNLPKRFPKWYEKVDRREYQHLDEPKRLSGVKVLFHESFNTPLSPLKPWIDGQFVFPSEWYWRAGTLTNDLNGPRQFPHLHFMHWKGGPWARQCGNAQWERLSSVVHIEPEEIRAGFRINETGFSRL